jgi:hypothetical protein
MEDTMRDKTQEYIKLCMDNGMNEDCLVACMVEWIEKQVREVYKQG